MKRKALLLLFAAATMMAPAGMQAQQPRKGADRVAEIRRLYAEAKELAAGEHIEENANYKMTITSDRVIPALGSINERLHFFFGLDDEKFAEDLSLEYHPYFITRSYQYGPRQYYEEYLFDRKTGRLVFFFRTNDTYEGDKAETRYYWGEDGQKVVHQTTKGDDPASEGEATMQANRLLQAFQLLVQN